MGTPRINYDAPLTRVVVASQALAADPFVLVDVGASGGIEQQWRQFEPHLRSYGFDPLVKEVQRLNRGEKNGNIRYFDAFVGAERYAEVFPAQVENDPVTGWSNQPVYRTSATRAQKFRPITEQQRFNNNDPEIILSGNRISLDGFFADRPDANVDFIKIDTDGYDYEVLFGADKVVRERGVLGFFVESQFHGVTHPHSNLYTNIDRYMREHGFSLFDLETYRYTRGVLPGHFVYQLAAQTHEGQVVWGDALFLRDVSAPGYDARWSLTLPPAKLLKLACLYEIFGMPDCAAELLVQRRDVLEKYLDVAAALDILAREIDPEAESFDRHNERFERGPELFYPIAMPTETERLRRETDQLQQNLAQSREDLARSREDLARSREDLAHYQAKYQADTAHLEGVVAEMQSSRSQDQADLAQLREDLAHYQAKYQADTAHLQGVVAEIQSSRSQYQADLAQSREDLAQSREDLAQSREDLAQSREDLAQSREDLARYRASYQADAAYLKGVIAEMESSRFWKLRLAVVGLMEALRIRPG